MTMRRAMPPDLRCQVQALKNRQGWSWKRLSTAVGMGEARLRGAVRPDPGCEAELVSDTEMNRLRLLIRREERDASPAETIEAMKDAAAKARREYVEGLLAEEQRKYGLQRRGRPLSDMPV